MRCDYLIDKVWNRGVKTLIRYRITSGPMAGRTLTQCYTADSVFESLAKPKKENDNVSRSRSPKA